MEQHGLFDVPEGRLFDLDSMTTIQRNAIADQIEFGEPRLFLINRLIREAHGLRSEQAS